MSSPSDFSPTNPTLGEKSPGEDIRGKGGGNGNPLQYSCLENPMDGGAWWAAVHGVARSRTWLSDFTFSFHFHALEKAMATHSSILTWRIPGTGEPGGLPSLGSHRVRHDWSDLAAAAAAATPLWSFILNPHLSLLKLKLNPISWSHARPYCRGPYVQHDASTPLNKGHFAIL